MKTRCINKSLDLGFYPCIGSRRNDTFQDHSLSLGIEGNSKDTPKAQSSAIILTPLITKLRKWLASKSCHYRGGTFRQVPNFGNGVT
jgi:hypothetical protein